MNRHTRDMLTEGGFNEADNSFNATIATAAPVQRCDAKGPFLEVLDPAGLEIDGRDFPLLLDHRAASRETVGRAHSLTIDGYTVHAVLRLALADDVTPITQRIRDGTLRHVSAGYAVLKWAESIHPETRQRTKTATRWRLLEVSLTPLPADQNAIIHRTEDMAFDLQTRSTLIENLRSACALPATWGADLSEEAVTDEEVREAAREAMLSRQAPHIRITRDNADPAAIQTRAADALAFRMAGGDLPAASREYVNMSLRDMASDSLARAGVAVRGLSHDDLFQRALGTSDFPLLVSNAMGKVAAQAYQVAESPLKALARQRTLPNFKESTSIRLGEMGRLEEMNEHGEFKHTSRGEAGEVMSLKTFGRAINVSRKLLIDDDLNLLGDMTAAMGQAAAQTEAEELVAMLSGNPVLSDTKAVFHATRGNLATGVSLDLALSETSLSTARKHMRTVKGLDGKTIIDAQPKYLVVSPELETIAEKLLASIYAATSDDVAVFSGKLTLVVEPRLIGVAWYLLADPARVASLQYGYLAAAQGVQIQRQEAWDSLGLKYRAFLDFGCGWLDWRGAYKSNGV